MDAAAGYVQTQQERMRQQHNEGLLKQINDKARERDTNKQSYADYEREVRERQLNQN